MARHFIAVGGSGQHVALAYVDLAALIHHVRSIDPINLYIIDRDQASQQGETAWQLCLKQVERLRAAEPSTGTQWADPTNSQIPPSRDFGARHLVREVVSPTYGPLYFNDEQLEVEYTTGYWGQAPVGAVFFGDLLQSQQDIAGTAVERIFKDTAGRVVVAGSMVGGTGAGCLPQLVEALGKSRQADAQRDANPVLALALLQWFALGASSQEGSSLLSSKRNAEMKSREPSSLLYSHEKLARGAATVLIGHPNPDTAGTPRPWSGNTRQPAYQNLTVPHYAAAVASNYLFGRPPARGSYSVVSSPSRPNFTLAPSMWVFAGEDNHHREPIFQLGNLVSFNLDLCQRLAWTIRYLSDPPRTRQTLFGRTLRVPRLDEIREVTAAAPGGVAALLQSLTRLLEAKWQALHRLAQSDPTLFATKVAPSSPDWTQHFTATANQPERGLFSLNEWTAQGQVAQPIIASSISQLLLATIPQPAKHEELVNPSRCLPATVARGEHTEPDNLRPGVLAPISGPAVKQLIAYERVLPASLPAGNSVEFFLDSLYSSSMGNFSPSPEQLEWIQRWRLLLLGIAAGHLHLAAPTADRGDVRVLSALPTPPEWVIVDDKNVIYGTTSPRCLLVPAVQSAWKTLADQPMLQAHGEAAARVIGWFALLEELHQKSARSVHKEPGWLSWNQAWITELRQSTTGMFMPALQTGTPVSVLWGNDQLTKIFLPVPGVQQTTQMRSLLALFKIAERPGALAAFKALHPDLADPLKCPIYVPLGPGSDGKPRKVVWLETQPAIADSLQFGVFLYEETQPNLSKEWVAGWVDDPAYHGLEFMRSVSDLLVAAVEPIGDHDTKKEPRYPDFPVQLRYAGLLEDPTVKPAVSFSLAGSATYRFRVKGLGEREVQVSVARKRVGTFLLWPTFAPTPQDGKLFKAYFTLADSNSNNDSIWFVGRRTAANTSLDWEVKCKCNPVTQPLYTIGPDRSVDGGQPQLFTIYNADDARHGIGLFRTELETIADQVAEQWGIDFGTSSTVVAASAAGATVAEVLSPSGDLDQTRVFALDKEQPVATCQWFPTWDKMGPRSSKPSPLLPSQLIKVDKDIGSRLGRAEELPYGFSYVLDHGSRPSPHLAGYDRVLRDLKWLDSDDARVIEERRALRRAYLIHLAELCFALRAKKASTPAGLKTGLPKTVHLVMTLPLRMKGKNDQSPAAVFEEDVRAVCETLGNLLGRTFSASFLWESVVGAPQTRAEGGIFAVADLGGGSLDMWGGFGSREDLEFADSYRFGGHDLLDQWSVLAKGNSEQDSVNMRRDFQIEPTKALSDTLTSQAAKQAQSGYFDLAYEAVTRWVAGLVTEARAHQTAPRYDVRLSLLGMGWGLSDATNDDDNFVNEVQRRVRLLLGAGDDVSVHAAENREVGHARKTYLARRASMLPGQTMAALRAQRTRAFLGFDLQPQGDAIVGWHLRAPVELKITTGKKVKLLFGPAPSNGQPSPPLPRHRLTEDEIDTLLTRMNAAVDDTPPATYRGQSPIGMVLEHFRTRTEPNRKG